MTTRTSLSDMSTMSSALSALRQAQAITHASSPARNGTPIATSTTTGRGTTTHTLGGSPNVTRLGDGVNWYAYAENNPLAFIDPTGLRPVDEIERGALTFTFGDDVGNYLADLIDIQFDENVETGRVPNYVDGKRNVSRIEFNPAYGDDSSFWLGTFIHEATHIWQRNTGLHRGRADGDYEYTLDQLPLP